MQMLFREVPTGARFTFRGKEYVKAALGMATADNIGHVFIEECEVESEVKGDASNSGSAAERLGKSRWQIEFERQFGPLPTRQPSKMENLDVPRHGP